MLKLLGMGEKRPYLNDELLSAAVSFVQNGDRVPREVKDRVQMAISLDNRHDLLDMRDRMGIVEGHFLHKLTPKRVAALLGSFLAISSIYIDESRNFLIELIAALLQLA